MVLRRDTGSRMIVERRPRQFLAVWTDDGSSVKGATFEESIFVDGQFWKNELTPVPLQGFAEIGNLFSASLQAQRNELAARVEQLEAQNTNLLAEVTELRSAT